MPERFVVECPGCGGQKGSYSTAMKRAGRSCSCGTVFRVLIDEQRAEEIEPCEPQSNGHDGTA